MNFRYLPCFACFGHFFKRRRQASKGELISIKRRGIPIMPKKSKRRANKASGGGDGKASKGGGAGTAGKDANNQASQDGTAKNFDNENNCATGGGDGSGILTEGAVQMFADQTERGVLFQFPKKEAPILQISREIYLSEIEKEDFNIFRFVLSDGVRSIMANATSKAKAGKLVGSKSAISFSAVRLLAFSIYEGSVYDDLPDSTVLIVNVMEVVERHVGRMIGNPTLIGGPPPSATPSFLPSVVRVYPYDKQLELATVYFYRSSRLFGTDTGNGDLEEMLGPDDLKAALDCLADFFRFPRSQTEPFRAIMLLQWKALLSHWPLLIEKMVASDCTAEELSSYDRVFQSKKLKGLLKHLASAESGEEVHVQALASFVRARTALGPFDHCHGGLESRAMGYFCQFASLWEQCDLSAIASAYAAVTREDQSYCRETLDMYTDYLFQFLDNYGSPPKRQVSSIFDVSLSSVFRDRDRPYFLTVGGSFCDCCGKSAHEVNLPILFKCKSCHLAWYCSKSCQAKSWAIGHREHCKKFGHFEEGDQVVLAGLKKRPEMNGTLVKLEELCLDGRAAVRILCPAPFTSKIGAILSIKLENLRHHRPLK